MVIGIDASRAFGSGKTGTENYSYYLIKEILRLPESSEHIFVLFIRPNTVVPSEIVGYDNVIVKTIGLKYLWTQVGLAWTTWQNQEYQGRSHNLEVLWIPAHTIPVWRNPKVKTVVTIHGLEYQWLKEYKNWLQRWYLPLSTYYSAKSATQLIAVSQFTKNQLKKEVHNIPKDIKVVHEGVASYEYHPKDFMSLAVLDKFGLESKKYFLFVGTIQPRKNLVALIQAFSEFVQMSPGLGYKLVIAGSVGWLADEILRAPGESGIPELVVFTGRVEDEALRVLYHQAKIYIQPSLTEGFGLPVLEAMSAMIPVVSSDGGALSEVVGEAGMVIPLNDKFVKNLADSMNSIVKDPKVGQKLVQKGKKRVTQFGWEIAAKKTLNILVATGLNNH